VVPQIISMYCIQACGHKNNTPVLYTSMRSGRPDVAQRVGKGIALLFHNCGTRRGWVVSSTTRPHFTPGKEPVPISQEAGWAPGPVWTGGRSRPHRDSIPDRPARSQSPYRLSYPAHLTIISLYYIQAWGPTNNIPVLYTSMRSDK